MTPPKLGTIQHGQRLAVIRQRLPDLSGIEAVWDCVADLNDASLFFGRLTYEEAAAALGISAATVRRELRMAKAGLHRDLTADSD